MKDKITTFERRIEMLFFITYCKNTTVPGLSICFLHVKAQWTLTIRNHVMWTPDFKKSHFSDNEFYTNTLNRPPKVRQKNLIFGGWFIKSGFFLINIYGNFLFCEKSDSLSCGSFQLRSLLFGIQI